MCGVAGLLSPWPAEAVQARVRLAMAALTHRGPDGEGEFLQPPGGAAAMLSGPLGRRTLAQHPHAPTSLLSLGLGHRRLAIIDPTPASAQPMASPDDRFVLAVNGEIYNYRELRHALAQAGTRFRTTSDTEVLLEGFARWGDGVFSRAVGMFAAAIIDRHRGTITLARDAFGMKPMYYAVSADGVAFASEPGVVLALLGLPPEPDLQSLATYLAWGRTDADGSTCYAAVRAVPAASVLRITLTTAAVEAARTYWAPSLDEVDDRPTDDIARDLRDRFLRSVELHTRADVAVGALLSGGLDSSAVVMAMRETGGRRDIHTFSYVPEDESVSEARWFTAVNQAAGAIAHPVRITRAQWEADAPALARSLGEPFGSPAVFAQSELFRAAAAAKVRVVLDGQGADEVFAGYARFRGVRVAAHLGRHELGAAVRLVRTLGPRDAWRALASRELFEWSCPVGWRSWVEWRLSAAPLVNQRWCRDHRVAIPTRVASTHRRHLQACLYDAVATSSVPALLRYADRAAMRHGVESRLPFLTTELVEFALRLPDALLVSDGGLGKAILRQALRGLVPDVVLDRRDKIGFAVPLRAWLAGEGWAAAAEARGRSWPGVDSTAVRGRSTRRLFLRWRLVGLGQWLQECASTHGDDAQSADQAQPAPASPA